MKRISICVPCYNEEKNVEKAYSSIKEVMELQEDYDYEIIFADNASSDNTEKIIREIAKYDKKVKGIFNYKNYGASRNTKNCLFAATGDAVVEIACDMQDPVDLIPEFIRYWEQGNMVVWGQKTKSEESPLKYKLRTLFYRIINLFSEEEQVIHATGYGIMDIRVVRAIEKTNEREMPLRYIVSDLGYPILLIPYNQAKRNEGKSSYNLIRYWNFAINSLVRTSKVPLQVATILGGLTAGISFVVGIIYLIYKLTHWNTFVAGIGPLIIAVFFLGAVQLVFIGVVGEYIGVVLDKVTERPFVIERERINFEKTTEE